MTSLDPERGLTTHQSGWIILDSTRISTLENSAPQGSHIEILPEALIYPESDKLTAETQHILLRDSMTKFSREAGISTFVSPSVIETSGITLLTFGCGHSNRGKFDDVLKRSIVDANEKLQSVGATRLIPIKQL